MVRNLFTHKILLFFIIAPYLCCAQSELQLNGAYFGQNLYVLNPSLASDSSAFCVKAVYVNNKQTSDVVASNAFEIIFRHLNIKEGEKVNVRIVHHSHCQPKVINPEVLQVTANFSFTSPRFDRNTQELTWAVSGTVDSKPFLIEQFRWDKWIDVGELMPCDTLSENSYSYPVNFHSGHNTFRIRHIDNSGTERISRETRFFSRTEPVQLISTRVSDWIYFSEETLYEIYDEEGFFIIDGFGKDINVTDFERGRYWVNFDNQTEIVNKR